MTIAAVRFEHLAETLGIGTAAPRLSWVVEASVEGWQQTAYEIQVHADDGALRGETGRVASDRSVLVPWPFAPLISRERLTVRVRAWSSDGREAPWSMPAPLEAGLLDTSDWTARFITPDWAEDTSAPQPAPLLRREFELRGEVRRARLYVTALGVYEGYLNGAVVGDQVLAPGWTSYHHRLRYQTFDVTRLLRVGHNALGAILGDGWYRGRLGFGGGRRNIYGDRLALLAQLEVEYADGSTERIVTDEAWRAATGPISSSDLYNGETYDARLERPGWDMPGYDDGGWAGVRLLDRELGTLAAPTGPPVRRTQIVAPVDIRRSPSGKTIVDFGQNLVGRLRIAVQGARGQTVTLRHAEVLQDGELCTRPLRTALATDRYTLRGAGVEIWEPRFTFHGFRYTEIEGWPGELRPDDVVAVVCHSDLERRGWFACSDPLLERLHENVVWSMRGNFLDVPTDCPQRDERLGWTGDIQVFAPTATFLYDVAGFLTSWLADLAAEQADAGGVVPFVVPNVVAGPPTPAAAWGDAAVIVPWVLAQRYGDLGILAAQYDSMRAWVDRVADIAGPGRLWDRGFQFGDWLDPGAPPDSPAEARTNPQLVATAYFARSAEILAQTAGLLGRPGDEACYVALAAEARAAFNREYVTPAGRLMSDAATAYALALEFALLPDPEQRRHAGERLVSLVRDAGYRVSTGFVGTPLICDALCSAGADAAAFRLLLQRDCPSWLYPVTMGATTVWERWDSLLPDGTVNPGQMTSFNHYALGAVVDWLHRSVAGLAPTAPGYRRMEVRPRVGGGLTWARARHRTPYGMAEASWAIEDGQMRVTAVVPPNATARIILPGRDGAPIDVAAGTHVWTYPYVGQATPHRRMSLDSTLDDVRDDRAAFEALAAVVGRRRSGLMQYLGASVPGYGGVPLRQLLAAFSTDPRLTAEIESALTALPA
ncbi:MAG: family 78 glycoside hydrolase catalytic domain [Chloroflexi bacterium]|nr:family 78 glycoside hydrolase catalytic domain [Chloroflexota bacterium]